MEKSHASKTYDKLADIYDHRWDFYIEKSNRETLERLDLNNTDKILDVGCGTGVLLSKIAENSSSTNLFGIDVSAKMLDIARSKKIRAKFQIGSAETIPFDSNSFDQVISVSSFHYWHQPSKGLKEIYRVLKPGGKFTITDWCDDYFLCKLCDFYLRFFDKAHFKTYTTDECEKLLRSNGFQGITLEKYKINWLWGFFTAKGIKPND